MTEISGSLPLTFSEWSYIKMNSPAGARQKLRCQEQDERTIVGYWALHNMHIWCWHSRWQNAECNKLLQSKWLWSGRFCLWVSDTVDCGHRDMSSGQTRGGQGRGLFSKQNSLGASPFCSRLVFRHPLSFLALSLRTWLCSRTLLPLLLLCCFNIPRHRYGRLPTWIPHILAPQARPFWSLFSYC